MIKKVFYTFNFKTKKNLGIFLILSIIFVFVEVSVIGSLYPIFQNFFSENTNNNSIMNYLNSFLRLDTQKELILFVLVLIVLRFIYFIYFNLYKNKLLQNLQKKIAEKIFKNFFTLKSYSEFINYNSSTLIRDIANETGAGVLIVEQHVHLALEVADRAYVMSHGEIVLEGSAEELIQRQDLLEASYLGGEIDEETS